MPTVENPAPATIATNLAELSHLLRAGLDENTCRKDFLGLPFLGADTAVQDFRRRIKKPTPGIDAGFLS
jgi:hypothetical protein